MYMTNKLQQEKDLLHANLISTEEKLKFSSRKCVIAEQGKEEFDKFIFIYKK